MAEHEEILKKAKCRLLVNEPFFGHLLSSITIIPHENIRKFQIFGNVIYYNIKYVESTNITILTNQLIHCIMHIAFCHFVKKKERRTAIWDMACDISVNNILVYENSRSVDGIYDDKYRGKAADNIYEDLKMNESNGGYSSRNDRFDEHIDTYDNQAEEEALRSVVEAHAVAKSIGKMPGGLESIIKDLLEPKLNWKEHLRKYATECFVNDDYSFINPRKSLIPHGIYCASHIEEADTLQQLVVAVDTSGSITDKILKEFCSEIRMLHHLSEKTLVITCDAAIQEVFTLNIHEAFKQIRMKGRGGTDFRPVFRYLDKNNIRPTLLIYLTDGYGSYPEKAPNYPLIWCLTNEYEIPFGNKILMDVTCE